VVIQIHGVPAIALRRRNGTLSAATYQMGTNTESAVPQIWMTYDELGGLMNCDALAAREKASAMLLDRRRSHDGYTRIKLDAKLTEIFVDRVVRHWNDGQIATCAADLFAMRGRMAARPGAADEAPSIMAG
jgi:hypothetical protein